MGSFFTNNFKTKNIKIVFLVFQEQLQEETKGKLAVQSKLRQAEDDIHTLKEQLEEEEEQKAALQKQITDMQAKEQLLYN